MGGAPSSAVLATCVATTSAASDGAAAKRRRYAEAGAQLIPLALEAGGRASDEAAAFVRLRQRLGACCRTDMIYIAPISARERGA